MPRFALLKHTTPADYRRPTHYDLLLEAGDRCRTWALAAQPVAGAVVEAEQLAPHRSHYLDYEGEVGGGRGHVAPFDRGQFEWLLDSELKIRIAVAGKRWRGLVVLWREHAGEGVWQLHYMPREEADDAGLPL